MKQRIKLDRFFSKFNKFFDERAPAILAETATEYYKERFQEKNWDGKAWPALSPNYKPKRGTMMLRSSMLMNSIRPATVQADRVVISAGNSKVPYARIHNTGETVNTTAKVREHTRNRYSKEEVSRPGARKEKWVKKKLGNSSVKAHDRKVNFTMPKRQYMGYSKELNSRIKARLKAFYNRN